MTTSTPREHHTDAERFDAFTALMDQPARTIKGLRELMSRPSVFVESVPE